MGGLGSLMDDLLPNTVLHLMVAAIIERLVMRFGGCCSLTQGKLLHLCDNSRVSHWAWSIGRIFVERAPESLSYSHLVWPQ